MKNLKLLLSLLFISGLVFMFSCDDDDDNGGTPATDPPSVTAPSGTTDVEVGGESTLTFSVQVPGGFKSASVSAVGGSASVNTQPNAGATSGNVEVALTAGTSTGAGSVTLTVTDNSNRTDDATAVLNVTEETQVRLTGNIEEDATWTADKVYVLGGRITVLDGVTLTIEPGTIIKGEAGTGANSTALLIARGGTLMAEGTAAAPIIFTSVADEIQPEDVAAGDFGSPNLDPDIDGLWGGVLILGRAPISGTNDNGDDVTELQIEGIPTSDPNGLYGGNEPADNSGVISYISIRHGGTLIGSGNEINGLTLGGVGSGTSISNVEIVANQDDGIEWFGGTVSVTNALVWNPGDDGIDTDQAWAGTLDNFIVVNPGDRAFELDGPEGSFTSDNHQIMNGTVYMGDGLVLIDFDASSDVDMSEIYFYGFEAGPVVEQYADLTVGTATNFEVTLPAGVAKADVFVGMPDAEVVEVAVNANTVGADATVFGWTWASQSGALSGIGL